jgi:hypothetical protein
VPLQAFEKDPPKFFEVLLSGRLAPKSVMVIELAL